jgi:hypothetical protein
MDQRTTTIPGARQVERRRKRFLAAVLWLGLIVVLFVL